MSELDRRVAIEVMGEPEPGQELLLGRFDRAFDEYAECVDLDAALSDGGNWRVDATAQLRWIPIPFSTSLEHALRALDEHFSDANEVKLHMDRVKNSQRTVYVAYASETRGGRTRIHGPAGLGVELAEAICHHLLALKEEEE